MTISDEILDGVRGRRIGRGGAGGGGIGHARGSANREARRRALRALRRRVQAAYSVELSEGVPESLLRAARAASTQQANVVNLQDARAAIERAASRARPPRPQWRIAGTIAASLIAGVGLGFFIWGQTGRRRSCEVPAGG